MSGRELDPDGTDSFHPEHPWEQVGHPLYLPPAERTLFNWPPERAFPVGPHEASVWDSLPVRIVPQRQNWRREYGPGIVGAPRPHKHVCIREHPHWILACVCSCGKNFIR